MQKKINSYMGFARKSGNIVMGTGTCEIYMGKKKVKLLIICEDTSENSKEKIIRAAEKTNTKYRVYGDSEELSKAVGSPGRTVFGITDKKFADTILGVIDAEQQ
jgi:ribosomal protein L7Ae-like RNA K-turn-binding protein